MFTAPQRCKRVHSVGVKCLAIVCSYVRALAQVDDVFTQKEGGFPSLRGRPPVTTFALLSLLVLPQN